MLDIFDLIMSANSELKKNDYLCRLYEATALVVDAFTKSTKSQAGLVGAVAILRLYASKGEIEAQYYLAICNMHGKGVEKNYDDAYSLFFMVIGNTRYEGIGGRNGRIKAHSLYALGLIYERRENEVEALKFFTKAVEVAAVSAASECELRSLYKCGYLYELGKGVPKDVDKALEYYKRAAKRGFKFAVIKYYELWKDRGSLDAKFRYYKLKAQDGDVDAIYNLGRCYEDGVGVERDRGLAIQCYEKVPDKNYADCEIRWLRLKAEEDNSDAQNTLAHRYYTGLGVKKDEKEALKWWEEAAKTGTPSERARATFNIGVFYQNQHNYTMALEYYQSINHMDPMAHMARLNCLKVQAEQETEEIYQQGCAYRYGRDRLYGVSIDVEKAKVFFLRAEERGHQEARLELYKFYDTEADAQCDLGDRYYRALGVKKNEEKAVELWISAADKGSAAANYNLGRISESKNLFQEAMHYYRLAVESGHVGAKFAYYLLVSHHPRNLTDLGEAYFNLGVCYERGEGVSEDKVKAKELYQEALKIGFARARVSLYRLKASEGNSTFTYYCGICFEEGIDIVANRLEALRLYLEAGKSGSAVAQYHLVCYYREDKAKIPDEMREIVASWSEDFDKQVAARLLEADSLVSVDEPDQYLLDAEKDDPVALYKLAICYHEEENFGDAFRYLELSAKHGYAPALNMLGNYYDEGLVVPVDSKKAFESYCLAASQGYAPAMFSLVYCYFLGKGTDANESKAIQISTELAAKGYFESKKFLAEYNANHEALLELKAQLALNGELSDQYALATELFNHRDHRPFPQNFYQLLLKSLAAQGLLDALTDLGIFYRSSTTNQDYAFKLLEKAASFGFGRAKREMAHCYYFGNGVAKNVALAVEIDKEFAARGWFNSKTRLANAYLDGYCGFFGSIKDKREAHRQAISVMQQGCGSFRSGVEKTGNEIVEEIQAIRVEVSYLNDLWH